MRLNTKINGNKNVVFRECRDFDAKNQLTVIWNESFFLRARMLIVTLVKELKPVVTEKHHFDNRDESFVITTFWNSWTFNISKRRSISTVLQSDLPLQVEFSIEILIEELKPGVAEKIQIEY